MFCTAKTRRQDAERQANSVLVLDHGASGNITKAAAATGVRTGVITWDESAKAYRINDPFTWADVDYLS
jgi:carbamoylphosphate synthase small subunit